jgi:hypothetical protein
MRTLLFALPILLATPEPAFAAKPGGLKPGARVEIAIPDEWDEDTKTRIPRDHMTVNEAGSIETCPLYSGIVEVKKVDKGEVIFEPVRAKGKGRCAKLVAPLDTFGEWSPEKVGAQSLEWQRRAEEFHDKLRVEVKDILEESADPCKYQGKDLKVGDIYKLGGQVYLYGRGTAVDTVNRTGQCQVELGGYFEVRGIVSESDHAVAVYHRSKKSSGMVPVSAKADLAKVCEDGATIVFSLTKMKEHFRFEAASMREKYEFKTIVEMLQPRSSSCLNVVDNRNEAILSRQHKLGHSGASPTGAEERKPAAPSGSGL